MRQPRLELRDIRPQVTHTHGGVRQRGEHGARGRCGVRRRALSCRPTPSVAVHGDRCVSTAPAMRSSPTPRAITRVRGGLTRRSASHAGTSAATTPASRSPRRDTHDATPADATHRELGAQGGSATGGDATDPLRATASASVPARLPQQRHRRASASWTRQGLQRLPVLTHMYTHDAHRDTTSSHTRIHTRTA
jgi:hypothetical protein